MAARKQLTRLKAPYLKHILLEPSRVADWDQYPWNLPIFQSSESEFEFTTAIILDEPESALSPTRQIELLKLLQRMEQSGTAQVIIATHSPLLMACPNARLFRISCFGLDPIDFHDADHFRMMRDFCSDPAALLAEALYEDKP